MGRPRRGTLSLMDRFAEALANTEGTAHDGDVPFVGRGLGLDTYRANDLMQRLRKAVGAGQAR